MFFLFQLRLLHIFIDFSVTFIKDEQNINKQYLTDKTIVENTGGVYVTDVADVDKRQWHILTLVWSFNKDGHFNYFSKFHASTWSHVSFLLLPTASVICLNGKQTAFVVTVYEVV